MPGYTLALDFPNRPEVFRLLNSDLIKGNWGGNTYGGSWQKVSASAGQTYQADAWFYVDNGWTASTWAMSLE